MSDNRQYTNGEITVLWQPDLCEHCGECISGLPQVFQIDSRPWVKIDQAPSAEIVAQVAKCPSGALSIKKASQ